MTNFKSQVSTPTFVPQEHEWERKWDRQDYARHEVELRKIKEAYDKCVRDCADQHMTADELYQVRHNGMKIEGTTPSGRHRYETVNLGTFEVNRWKMDKMLWWQRFNMTVDEKAESDKRIKELLAKRPRIGQIK